MKGFLLTHKGMESIAALEVKELIKAGSKINDACIVFNIKNYEDLFKLCYKSQSAIGIYYLLAEFDCRDTFNDFRKNMKKIKFSDWLGKNTSFMVRCSKENENEISKQEMEGKFGEMLIGHIQKKCNYRQKVSLNDPEIIIFVYLAKQKCYVGIEIAGFDLSKRSYKIQQHAADIRGTIGYYLVRLSEYGKNEALLDAFSGSGTIPIEAALFASKFPVNYYSKEKFIFLRFNKFKNFDFDALFRKFDAEISASKLKIYNIDSSMKHINYAKKNGKMAGIGKKLKFSRMDAEWLDTKFNKGGIDKIVSKMPAYNEDEIYNEFFYQAEFVLSNNGKIVLMGNKETVEKYSSKHKFRISEKREVFSGQMKYNVFILTKQGAEIR